MTKLNHLMVGLASSLTLLSSLAAVASPSEVTVPSWEEVVGEPVELSGVFGGERISYEARLERIAVQDDTENLGADIVAISYMATGDATSSARPVLFIFNGGPITSSVPLHIGALGPKRVSFPDDVTADPKQAELVDNPATPLDVADLVFFDPASTGLSTVHDGVDPAAYADVNKDAAQFVAFAKAWLVEHEREDSPIFILGESYGTMRASVAAGLIAEDYPEIMLGGVFLMGQAANIIEYAQRPQNIISYVVSLPTIAATAWSHDVVNKKRYSFDSFVNEATEFADTEYLEALYLGQDISDKQLKKVARKLSKYTGISEDYFIDHRLRMSKQAYRVELFKDKGLIIGMSDTRYIGEAPEKGFGADPSGVIYEQYKEEFEEYITTVFGFPFPEEYVPFKSFGGLGDWNWNYASPFASYAYGDELNKAFDVYPNFRLVVGNGYHDSQTTLGAASYLIKQSQWPEDRVKLKAYIGGHMAYSVDASSVDFGNDIREWIRGSESAVSE